MKKWILVCLANACCLSAFAANPNKYSYNPNQINFAYSNYSITRFSIPHPPSPFFWSAPQNAASGGMLRFTHIFITKKIFTLATGASVSNWNIPGTTLWAFSVFLEMRLWLLINPNFRAYFLYSLGGPTELSTRSFGKAYFSENFLFQDYLGLGLQFGKKRAFDIEAYTVHYSNGDIFTVNSGIEVPFMLSVGYSF